MYLSNELPYEYMLALRNEATSWQPFVRPDPWVRSDICLVARQILSYSPSLHDVYKRQKLTEQLKISSNSYPLLQTRHTSFQPTVPLRNYHETVIFDIMHDGNKVCLLNIHKIIACLYIFLIKQRLQQKH